MVARAGHCWSFGAAGAVFVSPADASGVGFADSASLSELLLSPRPSGPTVSVVVSDSAADAMDDGGPPFLPLRSAVPTVASGGRVSHIRPCPPPRRSNRLALQVGHPAGSAARAMVRKARMREGTLGGQTCSSPERALTKAALCGIHLNDDKAVDLLAFIRAST